MATKEILVLSDMEETSLLVGTYIVGPLVSGIACCLLSCIIRFASAKSRKHNMMQYMLAALSILFTILLNASYCFLGTDLIVPWNDNNELENDYDSNIMLEFTSLCIILWYFGKLFFYISFIYYAYSALSLSTRFRQYIKSFIYIQCSLTLISVMALIFLNHTMAQIAITPKHHIQTLTQLKGHVFYQNYELSLTEIFATIPLLTDIISLLVLFRVYMERSQHVQKQQNEGRQHIDLCFRAIMLLFCGGIPTWILFINIFIKSSIVWILIPYDMFINNMCLFLIFSENQYLYKLLFLNCHKGFFHCCFCLQNDENDEPIQCESFDASKSSQNDADDEKYENPAPEPNDYDIHDQAIQPVPNHNNNVVLPYGQYLNVQQKIDHSYKDSKNEGGLGMNVNRFKSDAMSSVDLSHSNIIKGIVIGSDKKKHPHQQSITITQTTVDVPDVLRDIGSDIYRKFELLNHDGNNDGKTTAESSVVNVNNQNNNTNRMGPFFCRPSSVSTYNGMAGIPELPKSKTKVKSPTATKDQSADTINTVIEHKAMYPSPRKYKKKKRRKKSRYKTVDVAGDLRANLKFEKRSPNSGMTKSTKDAYGVPSFGGDEDEFSFYE